MEDKNATKTRVIWVVFGVVLLSVGVAVAFVPPEVSDTTKLFLLGGALLTIGVWGRRKLRQG